MAGKTLNIPQQKTFTSADPKMLDKEVNEWLKQRAIESKPMPMHGKSFSVSNNTFVEYCAVYYYVETEELNKSE